MAYDCQASIGPVVPLIVAEASVNFTVPKLSSGKMP